MGGRNLELVRQALKIPQIGLPRRLPLPPPTPTLSTATPSLPPARLPADGQGNRQGSGPGARAEAQRGPGPSAAAPGMIIRESQVGWGTVGPAKYSLSCTDLNLSLK